jgi:hypothetical protein
VCHSEACHSKRVIKTRRPIKGVTLDVAAARFSVHGSREVVFRRRNVGTLAVGWAPLPFGEVWIES